MSRFLHSTSKKTPSFMSSRKRKECYKSNKSAVKQYIIKIQHSKHSGIPAVNNKSLKVNNLSKYLKLQEKD